MLQRLTFLETFPAWFLLLKMLVILSQDFVEVLGWHPGFAVPVSQFRDFLAMTPLPKYRYAKYTCDCHHP
jgi:hypothetical protein